MFQRRSRIVVVIASVAGLLASVIGLPLPDLRGDGERIASQPYPCEFRPCGCLTAHQCWSGDCCCFSLEQKIRWAHEKQIPLPAVAIEAARRMGLPTAPRPNASGSCCSVETASCCSATEAPRVRESAPCCATNSSDAASCQDSHRQRVTHRRTADDRSRMVIGLFANSCRGKSSVMIVTGLLDLPPMTPMVVTLPRAEDRLRAVPSSSSLRRTRPPTPPPRAC
ncbi:hypothetical protein [Planctomycetes bacterium Pan216]|uniref:hypothetical protein n=1 Tax=Kolteria novifilia TaxID=2527975 RepID=UPI0011A53461